MGHGNSSVEEISLAGEFEVGRTPEMGGQFLGQFFGGGVDGTIGILRGFDCIRERA